MNERELIEAVGRADSCELLSRAFSFPDEEFACALADGSCQSDFVSCLEDAGASEGEAQRVVAPLDALVGSNHAELFEELRREYSLLYLEPGRLRAIYPYESAFLHTEAGREGAPALFRSACTLDVERQMREAGVRPTDARKEPCDSIYRELEFLSFAFGSEAAALEAKDEEEASAWRARIEAFWNTHAGAWMPSFMRATAESGASDRYAAFAQIAMLFFEIIKR